MTRWQVFCAVALRKLPELIPKRNAIETKVQEIFSAWEVANSKFSNHEMDLMREAKAKESEDAPSLTLIETAQDREERWNKEKADFTFGPYDDRLTKIQYIFVKQRFGSDPNVRWLLPQAEYNSDLDTTLSDTGRRAINEHLKIINGYKIVSKIPSSVYSYKYPKQIRDKLNYDGAIVFFLKAHLDGPSKTVLDALDNVKTRDSDGNDRLRWLTKNEAFDEIKTDIRYLRSFSQGLFHEDRIDMLGRK